MVDLSGLFMSHHSMIWISLVAGLVVVGVYGLFTR
jgi:hypothetical protein